MSPGKRSSPGQGAAPKVTTATATTVSVSQQALKYVATWSRAHQAMSEVCAMAAGRGRPGFPAHEALELARAVLHAYADEAIDAEMLRHPSPRRLIHRSPRYSDLVAAVTRG